VRAKNALRWLGLALWCSQFALLDGFAPTVRSALANVVFLASSVTFSIGVFLLTRTRWARVIAAVGYAAFLVIQGGAVRFYHAPLDRQIVESAIAAMADVRPVVLQFTKTIIFGFTVAFGLQYLALSWLHQNHRPVRSSVPLGWLAALGSAILQALMGFSKATPEFRLVNAASGVHAAKPKSQAVEITLPVFTSVLPRVPAVLFVFGESLRASDYCAAPVPDCPLAPQVNALLPNRVALSKLRSVASYTAISVGAVFTGRLQLASQPELAAAPTLFDFLKATRHAGQRPYSVYYSGQWSTIFERPDTVSAVDRHLDVEDIFGRSIANTDEIYMEGVDRRLMDRFTLDLPSFGPQPFLTLHLSGTHVPYFMDPNDAPFKPYGTVVSWAAMPELHRTYQNAIRAQDVQVARAIRAFVAAQGSAPWLVLFTSDHGEAFGEHHAIHHGQNLYNEQTHVPGFVAWGNGALSERQIDNLKAHRDAPTTHLDILPTFLDLLGLWDVPLLSPYRNKMPGSSWLEPVQPGPRALPITNCSASYTCPLNAWGMLGDKHSVIAQPWDTRFLCVDLESQESALVEHPECDRLRAASHAYYPKLPNGEPNPN
jgi:glucan phosphoethanolaminetransferase (alkaline phosphatase superfamily)